MEQKIDGNQTIPFDGYGNTSFVLYRKSNIVMDCSDSSDDETGDINIECYGEVINYSYEKNKTIQGFFSILKILIMRMSLMMYALQQRINKKTLSITIIIQLLLTLELNQRILSMLLLKKKLYSLIDLLSSTG